MSIPDGQCRLCYADIYGAVEWRTDGPGVRCPDHAACAERAARLGDDPLDGNHTLTGDDLQRWKRRAVDALYGQAVRRTSPEQYLSSSCPR